jgi:TolB-like protein/Flp pilus assembly protein TadD
MAAAFPGPAGILPTHTKGRFLDPIRFSSFEVHPGSGELRSRGARVKLQDQPFRLLLLLLESPGQVVSREEIRARLWPANTFVDFDRGLNKAVTRLRAALGDDAERPRFVETLPTRGYRFIGMAGGAPEVTPARINSLAVLPLADDSRESGQEYFSDGMTEELITALAMTSTLRITSRTSTLRYKGARAAIAEIARELGVDAVVEGSVARDGGRVRITAQLIRAADDCHLWAGRYERELRDVLALQAEIAREIAGHIHRTLEPGSRPCPAPRPVDPQAYEACLRGVFQRDKVTPPDLLASLPYFARAIELDPGYAAAYAHQAQAWFYLGVFGVVRPGEAFPQAKASALRALELDDTLAIAHNSLAAVHILYEWDWARAEVECLRAVALNPSDAQARTHLADYLSIQGRHDEAVRELRRALEIDPLSRLQLAFFGLVLYRAGRYDEAIAQCEKALELDPYYPNAHWFLALALEQTGQRAAAVRQLEQAVAIVPAPHLLALLGRAAALEGQPERARAILAELQERARQAYVSPFDLAVLHTGLGDLDAAFALFEDACRQRVFRIIELALPLFEELRPDPRWRDLVHRIGLPEGSVTVVRNPRPSLPS